MAKKIASSRTKKKTARKTPAKKKTARKAAAKKRTARKSVPKKKTPRKAVAKTKKARRTTATKKTARGTAATARSTAPKKSARAKASSPSPGAKPRRKVPNPHVAEIIAALDEAYPDAQCSLDHDNAFQLLIATILSAQCTDARVNIVTKDLFRDYPTPREFAESTQEEIEEAVRTTGFFRNKAKSIRSASTELQDKYDGEIPNSMKQLNALAGVGRKTANVVLGNAFNNSDGVVVDTHVKRITYKLGLTNNTNPDKVEQDLNKIVPQDHWVKFAHQVILHGRAICKARNPKCDDCTLYAYCPTRS